MTILYRIYQYLIALPILIALTIVTALVTMLAFPFSNSWWLHLVQAFWARCFCYLMFIPVEVTGMENIRSDRSYVFVSNHQSFYDIFVIYGWLPVVFKWLMKKELRHVPFVGTACKAAGHIFVDRAHPRAAAESIKEAERRLVGGVSTVIFPEGTRTRTGQLGPFKRGAFQIALDLHLPVVPISLSGCYRAMPPGVWHIERHKLTMHIGTPIDLTTITDTAPIDYVRARVAEGIVDAEDMRRISRG